MSVAIRICLMTLFLVSINFQSVAQPMSSAICSIATKYLAANKADIGSEGLFAGSSLSPNSSWTRLSSTDTPVKGKSPTIYMAYFFSGPYVFFRGEHGSDSAGVVSIKTSVYSSPDNQFASYVDLYRPAIASGVNRCIIKGRREISSRRVSLGEYTRYHERIGDSSSLRDFHIKYPFGRTECAQTDRPDDVAQAFQFPAVVPVANQSLFSRIVGVNPAYGMSASEMRNDTQLRSELHYYTREEEAPACVGFVIRLDQPRASILIHDLSANGLSSRGSWLIHLQ